VSIPNELIFFALLSRDEQELAIRRLASQGMSALTIATATKLSVEQIRRILHSAPAGAPQP
jgi:DNA invertase Pin-like site-specific DNA recombinase